MRDVVEAIFYVARSGCQWRLLPKDFPPYSAVQRYSYAWRDNRVWQTIELQTAIKHFLAEANLDPRPFRWTKDPHKIIAAVKKRAPSVSFYPLG
jgi:putative transposase